MKLEIYESKKQWRWRITASNNKIIAASSEGFSSRAKAKSNFLAIGKAIFSLVWQGGLEI